MKGKIRIYDNNKDIDYEALGMDRPEYLEDYFFNPDAVTGMSGTPDKEDIIIHMGGTEMSIVWDDRIYSELRKRLESK